MASGLPAAVLERIARQRVQVEVKNAADMQGQVKQAQEMAVAATAIGQNARQMVLNRDPVLNDLKATAISAGSTIAAADAIHVVFDDRLKALEAKAPIAGPPGADGKSAYQLARDGGYGGTQTQWLATLVGPKGDKGDPGASADVSRITALETAVTTLQALKVTVGYGTATLSGSLLAGATQTVTVTLSRDMGSTSYSVGTGLVGGTTLLGQLVVDGVTAQTKTTVTVRVRNSGLASLANLSTAVVHVVAARDA